MARRTPPPNPLTDFARTLNPAGGALGDTLPFTLQAQTLAPRPPREQQRRLFEEPEQEDPHKR